jgi:uncharacterized cofD-like protein
MNKKIVVIGGGTGTFTVLSGLKKYPVDLSAVVSMADDGGSTGILRDELGVLPPGDIRQCLVALSTSDLLMRKLMNYRFSSGSLKGHTFGNILLSSLQKITKNFDEAIEKLSEILRLRGQVIPATLNKVRLVAFLANGTLLRGQSLIYRSNLEKLKKIILDPRATANPKALRAIRESDLIVIGPGDLYSSLIPNFLISGISRTIVRSPAKKVYICNLMNREGQTDHFTAYDYARKIEKYLGGKLDYVIYNNEHPSAKLLRKYMREGEHLVPSVHIENKRFIGDNLIGRQFLKTQKGDSIRRNLIRHNPDRLANLIVEKVLLATR